MEDQSKQKTYPIMSYQEYQKIDHPVPYEYRIENASKAIYYIGIKHSNSPEDHMFKNIEDSIEEFKPDLIMVEGSGYLRNPEDKKHALESLKSMDKNEVISSSGEMTFTLKIAAEKGIVVDSPDPTDEVTAEYALELGATKEEIFLAKCSQMILQWIRTEDKEKDLVEYLKDYIQNIEASFHWQDFDFSFENLEKIHEKILAKKIDSEDYNFYYTITAPLALDGKWENQSIVSKTVALFSRARDEIIVMEIEKALEKYDRVFVIMGSGHAVMQEPALKEIFSAL